jgi:hypothetical protein
MAGGQRASKLNCRRTRPSSTIRGQRDFSAAFKQSIENNKSQHRRRAEQEQLVSAAKFSRSESKRKRAKARRSWPESREGSIQSKIVGIADTRGQHEMTTNCLEKSKSPRCDRLSYAATTIATRNESLRAAMDLGLRGKAAIVTGSVTGSARSCAGAGRRACCPVQTRNASHSGPRHKSRDAAEFWR